MNTDEYSLVDLYGHGIPGILYADGQTASYREPVFEENNNTTVKSFSEDSNLALDSTSMHYGSWQVQQKFPITKSVSGAGLSLSDRTGNGQLDLMVNQSGSNTYWQAKADGNWTESQSFEKFPLFYAAPNQTQINATGAGLSDLLQIRDDKTYVYPSARAQGFDPAIEQERESTLPSMLESSETTLLQFADMAGSGGVAQFVKIEEKKVTYWPNLSYGRFAKPIEMTNTPDFSSEGFANNFRSDRLFLADIDGSGTTDLLYVGANDKSLI